MKNPGSSGLYVLSLEVRTIFARTVQKLYSRMLCHPCLPWILFQEHNPHSITKAEGLAMKNIIIAQRNTVGHKQKVSNKTTYNSSPKVSRELGRKILLINEIKN
jgi:hypothetical protein